MSAERWRPVPGYSRYAVSTRGRVWNWARGHYMACPPDTRGYPVVGLRDGRGGRKTHALHRLVLEVFAGPPPTGRECCHRDGDPGNARLENLRWGSRSSNNIDRYRHNEATGNPVHKLLMADVRAIREGLKQGEHADALALRFGVQKRTIWGIAAGRSWGWLR